MPNGANGTKINKQSYVSVAVLVIIISAVAYVVSGMTKLNSSIESQRATIEKVEKDYVPRTEIEVRLKNIETSVMRIENILQKNVR